MNMLPSLTLLQNGNDTGRDPVLTGYGSVSTGVAANGSDLILREFGGGNIGPLGLSVSGDLVAGVVGVRTPTQMRGIKARRIIATVKRQMVGWFGSRSAFKDHADDSCLSIGSFEVNHSVPVYASVRPLPASRTVTGSKAILEKLQWFSKWRLGTNIVKRVAEASPTRIMSGAPSTFITGKIASLNLANRAVDRWFVGSGTLAKPSLVMLEAPSVAVANIRATFYGADGGRSFDTLTHRFLLRLGIGQGRAATTVPAPLFYYGKGLI
jgi:hypothetical protein